MTVRFLRINVVFGKLIGYQTSDLIKMAKTSIMSFSRKISIGLGPSCLILRLFKFHVSCLYYSHTLSI